MCNLIFTYMFAGKVMTFFSFVIHSACGLMVTTTLVQPMVLPNWPLVVATQLLPQKKGFQRQSKAFSEADNPSAFESRLLLVEPFWRVGKKEIMGKKEINQKPYIGTWVGDHLGLSSSSRAPQVDPRPPLLDIALPPPLKINLQRRIL